MIAINMLATEYFIALFIVGFIMNKNSKLLYHIFWAGSSFWKDLILLPITAG
jgi:hypothetical protein